MQTLIDAFERVHRDRRVKYLILWDYQGVPLKVSKHDPVEILTNNTEAFVESMGLQKVRGKTWKLEVNGTIVTNFLIHQKGGGFMPETFESELLGRASGTKHGVFIPDMDHAVILSLWRHVHVFKDIESQFEKWLWSEYLQQRVGTKINEK